MFLPKALFDLLDMDSAKAVFYPTMVLLAGFLFASLSSLLFTLFDFLGRAVLRYKKCNCSDTLAKENNKICSNRLEPELEPEVAKKPESEEAGTESGGAYSINSRHMDTGYDSFASSSSGCSSIGSQQNSEVDSSHVESGEVAAAYPEISANKDERHDGWDEEESETPKFEFKFRFPTYEEVIKSQKGVIDSVSSDWTAPSTGTSKYEFLSGKNFSHFLEETEAASFSVKEFYADTNDHSIGSSQSLDHSVLSDGDSNSEKSVEEPVHEQASEIAETPKMEEAKASAEDAYSGSKKLEKSEVGFWVLETGSEESKFLSEKDFFASDFDSDSMSSSSVLSPLVASTSGGFLSEKDFECTIDGKYVELTQEELELEDKDWENLSVGYEPEDFDGEDSDIMDELRKLEDSEMQSENQNPDKFFEDACHEKSNSKEEEFDGNGEKQMDSEDSNGLELWEHQDLIEQLKMELKKVRATGLPTIFEESEYPKIIEDLKPWKIDEKFQYGDRMGELHKFYKSYRERMRKFDILNYQKMIAIGFLESKDPLHSISSGKSTVPGITSILSQGFRVAKRKKTESDPMKKFLRELHGDLEVVYVGQLCLSWEILYWQYEKALELWESDPYGMRQYNEVAGEFQQFQVLLQRFIENERFQGPRVENYVKNRCVMRNLLQVPVIRGDKRKERRGGNDAAITIDMLIEILEESMRIIWQFIRADKDATSTILMCRRETNVELQEPADSVLLMENRTELQKKEKKLRDILRSGSCILKRFQKCQEDGIDHHHFFCQVDMKLVSRVLNMSKLTTDQLVWCRSKLSQIGFVNRKMHAETSFLLFPCT